MHNCEKLYLRGWIAMGKQSVIRKSPVVKSASSGRFSPNNLSKRATLTSLASSLDYVAGIAVQFVINPLLVHGLGSYLYGAWRVLYSMNGYLWAAGGRSAQALTWVIAHNQQREISDEEKRKYIGSAITVWLLFLPFLLLIGGLASWFAPILLKTPSEYVWGVRGAAALLTVDAIALTLLSIPRSALQGENLGYKRMGLSAILILVGGGFMALATYLDMGIVGVALANAAGTLITGFLFLRVARKYLPWFGVEKPDRQNTRWFLGLSGWFTGWKFVYELLTAGDVIVLGIFGSVELVTIYTLTKFVTQSIIPLIAILFEGTSPGLGAIIGSGNTTKAIKVRNEIMSMTWLLATVLGASLLLWNRSFVDVWVGSRFYTGPLAMVLIVVMVVQFIFIGNDARIIDLTLNLRAKVLVGAIAAICSVALAAVLIETSGNEIVGMCVGIITGRVILTVAYPWLIGRMVGQPLQTQLRSLPRPALATVTLFAFSTWLGEQVTVGSWLMLVLLGAATVLTVTPVAGVLGLTGGQRRTLYERLRRVIRKSSGEESGPPSTEVDLQGD